MAWTKTKEEIDAMREGGALLSRSLAAAVAAVRPGVTLKALDEIAEAAIRAGGGTPSFKGYKTDPRDTPFPSTVCISVNEEVVHGHGNREIILKEGDVVGLDIGCWYKGLCTDMAVTVPVGKISDEDAELLRVTKESCLAGANALKVGGLISDVGRAVESVIKPHGYGIVRALVGHGVGHKVHEGPNVPNFSDPRTPEVKVVSGMCLAVEPMIGLGTWKVDTGPDGWAVIMADGKHSAHFEVTLAVTDAAVATHTPLPV